MSALTVDPNTKVLLAEDSLAMRNMIFQILKGFGYKHIVAVSDGMEAWEALKDTNHKFDVILSDWNMPRMEGIELLQRVRADDRLKSIPFIMLTIMAEQPKLIDAIQSGVDNYITKPFTPLTLKEKLEKVFTAKRKPA